MTRTRSVSKIALWLGVVFGLTVMGPSWALGHEGKCPLCKLDLVQNTDSLDYEVVVKVGNKKIEYRCIYCVFGDQKRYKTDLVVYAPSEKPGEPVVLKRTAGVWSAPDSTVFLNSFAKHKTCATESRTFSSQHAFDRYVAKRAITDAVALTLDEMLVAAAERKE